MVLTLFALPLLLMSAIYLRIFIIISRHQKDRRVNHERSILTRGVIDTVGSIGTAAVVNLPELIAKTDAVRCAACAAQALRDDDDPTVSILSETSEEATARRPNQTDDGLTLDQVGAEAPDGSSAAGNPIKWNIIDRDSVTGTDYDHLKRSVSNWSQSSSVSPSSIALDQQQGSAMANLAASLRKTNDKDQSESLCLTYLSDAIETYGQQSSSSIGDGRNFDGDNPTSQQCSSRDWQASYNHSCDQYNGKTQATMEKNKIMVQDNSSRVKLHSTLELKSRARNEPPIGDNADKLITDHDISNDTGIHKRKDNVAQEDEETNLDLRKPAPQESGGPVTKTVSLAGSYTDARGGLVSSASLKARRSGSSRSNKKDSKAPLEGQLSLGAAGSGFNGGGGGSKREPQLLTLPDQSRRLAGKQQARCRFHKAEKHFSFDQQPQQKGQQQQQQQSQQQSSSGRLGLQQSSLVATAQSSPIRDCTCGNKLRQFNAKLSRSNTIGDHANNVLLNYKFNTRTMVTTSDSQRSSISSAFKPSSIRSKLRRSPTSGSLGANIQADYRSSNNHARQLNNSTTTNVTANSSIYEPQRRHIHASATPQTNTKALITTLLILGTYFISYVPAIIYQVLTCVDYCPYPLYTLSFSRRVLLGAMTTLLLIAKSIIDPFIYSYRMSEIQMAINRYLSKRKSKSSMAASMQASQRLTAASCFNNNNNNNPQNNPNQNDLNKPTSSPKILNGANSDRTRPLIQSSTVLKLSSQPKSSQTAPLKNSEPKASDQVTASGIRPTSAVYSKIELSTNRDVINPTNDPLNTQQTRDENIESEMLALDGGRGKEAPGGLDNEANTSKGLTGAQSSLSSTDRFRLTVNDNSDIVDEQTSLISSVAACNGRPKIFIKNDSYSPQANQPLKSKGLICDDI